jgi:hypothetical protein
VAAVLALALLAGAAIAATQLGSREAIITDQAVRLQAVTQQQQATADILTRAVTYHERVAALDGAIIAAYGTLEAQRAALEQARRGEYSEVYESTAIAEAAVAQTQSRLELLLAQRQMVLTHLNGYEAT